jgi:uncharacterized membrane protein YedE/YeeE
MSVIEFLSQPWPWYVAGPIIATVYMLLLWFGKSFGISATLHAACSMLGAGKRIPFFRFDWRTQTWNLLFVLGSLIGGFLAATFLSDPAGPRLAPAFTEWASANGLESWKSGMTPTELFDLQAAISLRGLVMVVVGGFLVGFGSRYAGGCTSGHAISGLSNLQLPSLVAVIGFFIGGLIVTWLLMPHILAL